MKVRSRRRGLWCEPREDRLHGLYSLVFLKGVVVHALLLGLGLGLVIHRRVVMVVVVMVMGLLHRKTVVGLLHRGAVVGLLHSGAVEGI